jgi:DNA-binding transcriptional MocR family regulator
MTRYEILAETIATEIQSGRLATGTRLPSVRNMTTQCGVGRSTVTRAYHLLEKRGLVHAKERSGYFVAPGVLLRSASANARSSKQYVENIDAANTIWSALAADRQLGLVPFGATSPSPRLFPLPRLAKSISKEARLMGSSISVSDMPGGIERLRLQIALRYAGMGISLPMDDILVTSGAVEAINLCLMAVTKPGDIVAIEKPCLYTVLHIVKRLGLQAIEIPVDPHSGLDLGVLAETLDRFAVRACVFMTNFQNPTGVTLSEEKKKALLELLSDRDVPLIEDDVCGELYFNSRRPLPAKAYDKRGIVMHCSSLSKTLAPGYRLGWIAAGKYTERIRCLKMSTTGTTSLPIQAGIADYLEHGGFDKHLRRLRNSLRSQLASMTEAISTWLPSNVYFAPPAGGFFLWLHAPGDVEAMQLFTLARHHRISIAPGPIFSANGEYQHHVRLSFGDPWTPRLQSAVQTLGILLGFPGAAKLTKPAPPRKNTDSEDCPCISS